ncbi:MAG: hypothetical protein QOD03_136, partial [Verrucomicrobiota bacterium]
GGNGTDILHLSIRNTMANQGIEQGAGGSVALSQNIQGNANKQVLTISVNGLTAGTAYELFAAKGDDTNLVDVAQFTTDGNGAATLKYSSVGNGKGKGPVPDGLQPLRDVRTIAVGTFTTNVVILVTNVATNVVLSADMTVADKLQYLVKRDISSVDVPASLRIKATQDNAQFRLSASNLAPTTEYFVAVNDVPQASSTTDANGQFDISATPPGADILTVHSVALWDSSSNVVVSTTLP